MEVYLSRKNVCWIIILVTILCLFLGFIAFGLVPLLCELGVHYNWNGLGTNNRWFYFFYFLTIDWTYDVIKKSKLQSNLKKLNDELERKLK